MDNSQEEIINLDEEYFMPVSNEWKKCFLLAKNYCEKNLSVNKSTQTIYEITNIISLLINQGNVSENVIIKTAIMYILAKNANYDVKLIEKEFSKPVYEGVCDLLNTQNKEKSSYLKNVFLNTKYSYLGKIKLCEYISLVLKNNENESSFLQLKTKAEIELVLKKYSGVSYKKLASFLQEKLNSNKI